MAAMNGVDAIIFTAGIGENNIVSTKKERDLTREEFFRGENDET